MTPPRIRFALAVTASAWLGVTAIAPPACLSADECVGPPPSDVVERFGLDPSYMKHVRVGEFSIVGCERVSDYALLEAAYLVGNVLSNRPDVLKTLDENKVRMVVMAHDQMTTDVPEHRHLKPKVYWDRRARGLGADSHCPVVSCGEENLLGLRGDPYATENLLIHEFAHAIHLMALKRIDPKFQGRLESLHEKAMAEGLWKNTYAATNPAEYFAEGVQSYFDTNRENDAIHNHVDTREDLEEYDPRLASLLRETFGDTAWRYVKPVDRSASEHLTGFDRASAPPFAWPERLAEEGKKYRKASD